MNNKTIRKRLRTVFDAWVESIENEGLRESVKKYTIISGGSIASLLLGEPVNDYDIYFTSRPVAQAVQRYYINKFVALNPGSCIPETLTDSTDVREDRIPTIKGILSEKNTNAIDRDVENDEEPLGVAEEEGKTKPAYRPVYITSNAITLSNQIQIITRFFGEPDVIHANYDFVHCTNYWLSRTGELVLRQEALESLLAKELVYSGSLFPVCSVIRTRKFIKRGWHINAGQYLKIMFQVSNMDLTDINILREQLIGVDSAYFYVIIEALEKHLDLNPDTAITPEYLIAIVDRVFNSD